MKYSSPYLWITLLTTIIIFDHKIYHARSKPVKKIVSWYSQIHSKDNPPEIFIQDEEKEEIVSTTVSYKQSTHDMKFHSKKLKHSVSLTNTIDNEDEVKDPVDSDTSLNFLQPDGAFLDEDYGKNETEQCKLQSDEYIGWNVTSLRKTPIRNVTSRFHKKLPRAKIAKKVKRVKINVLNTTEYHLSVTVKPMHDNSSLVKRKLMLKDCSKFSTRSNMNINDPNIVRSLKQIDLSILSFPPAFMYNNPVHTEHKSLLNDEHNVEKRFIPSMMLSDLQDYNFHKKLRENKCRQPSNSRVTPENVYENAFSNVTLRNKLQLPNENDSCNLLESLPIILIKPNGMVVNLDSSNKILDNILTQSRSNEGNNMTIIPIYVSDENSEGFKQDKLLKTNT